MHNVEVRVTDDKDGHHQPEYEEEYDVGGGIVCSALPIHRAAANNTKQDHAFALVNTHHGTMNKKLSLSLKHARAVMRVKDDSLDASCEISFLYLRGLYFLIVKASRLMFTMAEKYLIKVVIKFAAKKEVFELKKRAKHFLMT